MKHLKWIFLTTLCLLLFGGFTHPKVYDISPAKAQADPWNGYALLKHIASCESWGDPNKEPREFNASGTVLRGYPNPNDVGLAQINLPTWGAKAKELGDDLFTYQGNLAFAKWLFDHEGDAPWKYSKNCWQKYAT